MTTTRATRRDLAALAVPGLAAAALLTAFAPASHSAASGGQQQARSDLAAARAATARFHDVDAAVAAGYQPDPHCERSALGTMGHHYLNPANIGSTDPGRPAVLLYAPHHDGGLRLAGVEWVVPDADQDLATDGDRPSMFGGQAFQGPMEGHVPGMPRHYDLHVWTWLHNPAGLYEPWSTGFAC